MSILHHMNCFSRQPAESLNFDDHMSELYKRDLESDLKHGVEMIFEFKNKIEKFHPLARETIIKMMSY